VLAIQQFNKIFQSNPIQLPTLNISTLKMTDAVQLPSTLIEYHQLFKDVPAESPEDWSPNQTVTFQYSGAALHAGRPLDTTMIYMAGESGSGKSTTINILFDDETLRPTNSSRSETREPVTLTKHLCVKLSTPPVKAKLTFVDIPGFFDTNTCDETANLASIRNFTESRVELQSRTKLVENASQEHEKCESKVYPNLVLFVVKASDNRIDGPYSSLRKSLEAYKVLGIVDTERPNLIVVLSHARQLGPTRKFTKSLEEKRIIINRVVRETLGIPDVYVVPIENDGAGEELPKEKGFYVLPNKQKSHQNLLESIKKLFETNQDTLGLLLVGWYFCSDCPDKNNLVEIYTSKMHLEATELESYAQELHDLLFPVGNSAAPKYIFNRLGYGYCPVTEDIKPVCLFKQNGPSKIMEIRGSKFFIPDCVQVNAVKKTKLQKVTHLKKEEYERHKKIRYGIDADSQLNVRACADGRWISDSTKKSSSSLISMNQEIHVANIKLDNPQTQITDSLFLGELNNLPDIFSESTGSAFKTFFSRWGTHVISEQALGGSIQLNCWVKQENISEKMLSQFHWRIGTAFEQFLTGQGELGSVLANIDKYGISKQDLKIDGGIRPSSFTLDSLDNQLQEWASTIHKKPTELQQTIMLYPYYHILYNKKKRESLQQATAQYMASSLRSEADEYRNKLGEDMVNTAIWNKIVKFVLVAVFTALASLNPVVGIVGVAIWILSKSEEMMKNEKR